MITHYKALGRFKKFECTSVFWNWDPYRRLAESIYTIHTIPVHPHKIRQHNYHFLYEQMGRVRSFPPYIQAVNLWNWCIQHHITLLAMYLLGIQNSLADNASRRFTTDHKWELHDSVVNSIFTQWGAPTWNLTMWTPQPARKCKMYCSRGQYSRSDALLLLSTDHFSYAFPSIPLLPWVLWEIWLDGAQVILLHPRWPEQFGFQASFKCHPPLNSIWRYLDLLTQKSGRVRHPAPDVLHLMAWYLDWCWAIILNSRKDHQKMLLSQVEIFCWAQTEKPYISTRQWIFPLFLDYHFTLKMVRFYP